jgi:hypothetical protein
MDGHQFDAWTRRLSQRSSRRGVLRGLAAAGALVGLLDGRTAAAPRCRDNGHPCGAAGNCCSDYCPLFGQRNVRRCAPCDGVGCGDVCCPPETVACTELALPDGTVVVGCLCPGGSVYRDGQCASCAGEGRCCGDKVECCPGYTCCGGECISEDTSFCCADTPCFHTCECSDGRCLGDPFLPCQFLSICVTAETTT